MTDNPSPHQETADAVVAYFKSHANVARALGYEDLRNVSPWTTGKRPFPPHHCVTLERESHGALTCEYLDPEQNWVRIKDKSWPNPAGRPLIDHSVKVEA
jgi:DNA-binding transcriptional regulator YdaS (Cro superfamily)